MDIKFSFSKIKQKHDETFYLNRDQKIAIAESNYKSTMILMHIGFVFGFVCSIIVLIRNFENLEFGAPILLYFILFTFFDLVGLVLGMLVKKIAKNKLLLDIPFYFAFVALMAIVVYRFYYVGNILTGFVLISIMSMVILIFTNPNPLVFDIVMLFPFVSEIRLLMIGNVKWDIYADFILLYIVLCLLARYKRSTTKRALLSRKELEKQKHALEEEFAKQSTEIEEQAVELLHQNRKLVKMTNETIISLSNLVENRDSDTGGHVKRTSEYVNILAREALRRKLYPDVIDWEFVELATKSAPLHDIGKIVVPDSVLKKPGRLTDEEFEQIKRHASEGGKIVKDVLSIGEDEEYLKTATDIAMYHHEKWNGKGYPEGLKGDQIPVSARIMALADVFDALVSKRCYKEAMSYDEAFECIAISSGSHFDPALCEIFLEKRELIEEIAEQFADK